MLIYVIDLPMRNEHFFTSPIQDWIPTTQNASSDIGQAIFVFNGTAVCAVCLAHTFDPLFQTR